MLGVVAAGVAYGLVTTLEVWTFGRRDEARAADAIVVMGAAQWDGRPSPVLAARLDHAIDLYREGYAPTIVVTGGKLPADRFTEAAVSAGYLRQHGVPDSAIASEDRGRTSWQELQAVAALLVARVPGHDPAVLLVSDPYHQRRIVGMAGELGLTAYSSPTRTSNTPWLPIHYVEEAAGVGFAHVFGYHNLVWIDPG